MLDNIKLGEKEHPILIGHYALRQFEIEYGKPLHKADIESMNFFYTMLYCGIKHGYRKTNKEFPFKDVDDLTDAIDGDFKNIQKEFLRIWKDHSVFSVEGEAKPKAK